jgi:hypothetical protein
MVKQNAPYRNNEVNILKELSAPQNAIVVNGSAGAAVLSGALTKDSVRFNPTVDMYVMFTSIGSVTPSTGHFIWGGQTTDLPRPYNMPKVSVIAVGTGAGVLYLSELG